MLKLLLLHLSKTGLENTIKLESSELKEKEVSKKPVLKKKKKIQAFLSFWIPETEALLNTSSAQIQWTIKFVEFSVFKEVTKLD